MFRKLMEQKRREQIDNITYFACGFAIATVLFGIGGI